MKRLSMFICIIFCAFIFSNYGIAQNNYDQVNLSSSQNKINILLIIGDCYGSSLVAGDTVIPSIKQQFEDFGWNLTIAGINDTIRPCPWGENTFNIKSLVVTTKITELKNTTDFDAIIILPGRDFSMLMTNNHLLELLKKANNEGKIIAAWCRGVRLLAAANIIKGRKVIGHFDYFEEYKEAGANYVEYSFMWDNGKKIFKNVTPPIRDGNIITTVRSLYYRNEMCHLIKKVVEEIKKGDK